MKSLSKVVLLSIDMIEEDFRLESISENLVLENGIYFSEVTSKIHYPEDFADLFISIEENSFWFKHRNRIIVQLANLYCEDKVFFDIGGGNGYVSAGLMDAGFSPVLIEPHIAGCLNAKIRNIPKIVCSTLEDAKIKNHSLPNCGAFDVIEHLPDAESFCAAVSKSIKIGGVFIGTMPAHGLLWSAEDVDAGHKKRYSVRSTKKLLNDSGFEVQYVGYFFGALILPIFLFRSIPSLFGIIKKKISTSGHSKDHYEKPGLLGRMLNKTFDTELNKIRNGKRLCFGTSIIFVAKKI